MSILGKKIRLKGKSQKGKNRVREHGDDWSVLAETDRVLFSPTKSGPWLYIVPIGRDHDDRTGRWMHGVNDVDFDIIQVDNV